MVRRLAIAVAALTLLVAFLLVYLTLAWFVNPSSDDPGRADAAVVYAGGRGERLDVALALARDGIVDAVLINEGVGFDSRAGEGVAAICANPPEDLDVRCIVATPDSTRGEGASFARYSESQGWDSLVAVSTDHHLRRAELWLGRCFDGEVYGVAGDAPTSTRQVRHEWMALIAGYVVDRSCPPPE